ncbi:MAG: DUF4157 domain-containing protein [Ilumatobacteraceae bacterium]
MGAERASSRRDGEGDATTDEPRRGATAQIREVRRSAREALGASGPAPGGPRGAGALVVGAADDAAEHQADRMADEVMRRLAEGGASDTAAPSPTDTGRIARRSGTDGSGPIGAEGGALDGDTSARIERARRGGDPLPGDVRRTMESGFGADLGRVRLHTGGEATRLNDGMGAQAFTVGSDVFVHDRAPGPSTPAGQHLLAHELSHTLQQPGQQDGQGGGTDASRQVSRRLWDTKQFNTETFEGTFVASSSAQKAIRKMLERYHAAYPWEKQLGMESGKIDGAIDQLVQMREVAKAWIAKHTTTNHQGEEVRDDSRMKRRGGMEGFIAACNAEIRTLHDLKDYTTTGDVVGGHEVEGLTVLNPSDEFTKVKAHYDGDVTSSFRKLGRLIDSAVPLDGDAAEITIEVRVPIPPGYVGIEIGASASRDGTHVEVGANAGVTGGASVDIASIGGALGGYVKSKAKTGGDAAELLSYALFRRCRQSNLLPREITNALWGGGQTGGFAWTQAENWSLDVENRIFGSDADAEVESGGYAKAGAEIKLSKIAGLEMSAKGTLGTKVNQETLNKRKGGAGKGNLRSGTAPASGAFATAGRRGAQKSVGVGTGGLELSFGGKVGPFDGSVSTELGWSSDGAHGTKTISFDTFTISGGVGFTMPGDAVIGGGVGNIIPKFIEFINRTIRSSVAQAEAKERLAQGGGMVEAANYTGMVAELAMLPKDAWKPFAEAPDDVAGFGMSSESKYSLGVSFDFMSKKLAITLNQEKAIGAAGKVLNEAGDVSDVFKAEMKKTSRLLKLTYASGRWTPS